MVWRVRLRAEDGEVDVFLLLEFQSSVDREMILRVNSYTSALYRKLGRGGATMMPAMLPIVIYDGEPPWSAALGTEEIVPKVRADMPSFQLRQHYFLVDVHRLEVEDLPEDNVFSFRGAGRPVRVASGSGGSAEVEGRPGVRGRPRPQEGGGGVGGARGEAEQARAARHGGGVGTVYGKRGSRGDGSFV